MYLPLTQEEIDEYREQHLNSQLVSLLRILTNSNEDFKKESIPAEADEPFRTEVTIINQDLIFVFGSGGYLTHIGNLRPRQKNIKIEDSNKPVFSYDDIINLSSQNGHYRDFTTNSLRELLNQKLNK
jgi:hypothetical protein